MSELTRPLPLPLSALRLVCPAGVLNVVTVDDLVEKNVTTQLPLPPIATVGDVIEVDVPDDPAMACWIGLVAFVPR